METHSLNLCRRQYAEIQNSEKEQLNMAKAQEDSREQSQNIPLQQQWGGEVVRRKVINDRVGKTTPDIQENRSKEQGATTARLPDCQWKEGGATLSRLWEELAGAQEKLLEYQTRLEVIKRRRRELVREKIDMQMEVDVLKCKLRESEDMCVRSERQIHQLKSTRESSRPMGQTFYIMLYNVMRWVLGMVWGFRQLE
ncbi:hypothetical protein AAFF_G00096390 [Aldrovandia affinis]|uniref:Uncharacterized protein n=1 Tax=Aldrovandia affinis TaxID=143900 RepID=A0AAD7RVU7_9TELE|nr:hypothetical protein AAFF_G00096390 [Aldrovandia affinis]